MRTARKRRRRLGLLLAGVAVLLLLAWLLLSLVLFLVLVGAVVFCAALIAACYDGWQQTTGENLMSRGMYPDERSLVVMDPGLRRDYQPMVPAVLRRRASTTRRQPRAQYPAARRRGPATPAAAAPPAARAARTRQRRELLHPDATITIEAEWREAGIENLFATLNSELVGLAPVKEKVAQIGSLLLVDRARNRFGLTAPRPNLHMCFTGSPGTGKTTVALMMADLLYRLGYLPTGQLVHAMRDDLVGEYIGHTAPKTKHVLDRAMGGVLFIDEAYSLHRPDDSLDYGQESLDILMQVMENERQRVVVILAGYQDRMDSFFESNPGMRSRIAHHLDFAAYRTEELLDIGRLFLDRSSYYLSDEATAGLRDYLAVERSKPDFANARSVRNALDDARLRHAFRLTAEPERAWNKDDLMRLEVADILA